MSSTSNKTVILNNFSTQTASQKVNLRTTVTRCIGFAHHDIPKGLTHRPDERFVIAPLENFDQESTFGFQMGSRKIQPQFCQMHYPRLIHDRDERALQRHRIAEYLFLTGALQ